MLFQRRFNLYLPAGKLMKFIRDIYVKRQKITVILFQRLNSDHELIRKKIRIKLKKHKQNSDSRGKKCDTSKLQQPEKRRAFSVELENRFQLFEELDSVKDISEGIERGYIETANNILGVKEKEHKPWMRRESWKLVLERKHLKQQITKSQEVKRNLRSKYSDKDRDIKCNMLNDKKKWTEDMMTEAHRESSQ